MLISKENHCFTNISSTQNGLKPSLSVVQTLSELKLSHLNVLTRLTVHYYRITFYVGLHRKLTKVNKKPRLNVLCKKGVQRISFYLVTNSKDYTGRSS